MFRQHWCWTRFHVVMTLNVQGPDSEPLALEGQVAKRDYQRELGQAIQALRKASGLKQADLAEAADVSAGQVSNIERGDYWPSVPTLIAFAERLGVKVSDLFAFELGPDDRLHGEERVKLLALTNRLTRAELAWAIEVLVAAVKRPAGGADGPRRRSKRQ